MSLASPALEVLLATRSTDCQVLLEYLAQKASKDATVAMDSLAALA